MFKDLSGFKLLRDSSGNYKLVSSRGTFKGTAQEVMRHAIVEHGFTQEELDFGMQAMAGSSHDGAEFGMFRMFMWSFKQGENDEAFATRH